MRDTRQDSGGTMLNVVIIVLIVGVVAVVLFPVFVRERGVNHGAPCQNNMKELGLAINMYYGDYDATLPSSDLNGGKTWDPAKYRYFATQRGIFPPEPGSKPVTWAMLLYPYMKNKDIIRCPRDPVGPDGKTVSYFWKAAIDRAWFDGCTKDGDFDFPSDQIVFYERGGWHWGDQDKGLSNGVTLNVTFMDGHVASKRLADAGNAYGKSDPLATGEPGWFNCDMTRVPLTPNLGKGMHFNPHKYGDVLP